MCRIDSLHPPAVVYMGVYIRYVCILCAWRGGGWQMKNMYTRTHTQTHTHTHARTHTHTTTHTHTHTHARVRQHTPTHMQHAGIRRICRAWLGRLRKGCLRVSRLLRVRAYIYTRTHAYKHVQVRECAIRLVGSLKLYGSCAYKTGYILQKRPIILRSL